MGVRTPRCWWVELSARRSNHGFLGDPEQTCYVERASQYIPLHFGGLWLRV